MIRRTMLVFLLSPFCFQAAAAEQQYALECRGGGDLVTFYRHTHNTNIILWKFRWAQNEKAEPQAGECRYIGDSSGFPRPNTLFHKGRQKDGYGAEFVISRNKDIVRAVGPENDQVNRRLLTGSQLSNLHRFCVTYGNYDYAYTIHNVQYVKGFTVKSLAPRSGCS